MVIVITLSDTWKYSLIMLERRGCPGRKEDWWIWGSHVCSWFKRLSAWWAPDHKPFALPLLARGGWVRFLCPCCPQSSSHGGAPQESSHTKHLLFCQCLSKRLWKVLSWTTVSWPSQGSRIYMLCSFMHAPRILKAFSWWKILFNSGRFSYREQQS